MRIAITFDTVDPNTSVADVRKALEQFTAGADVQGLQSLKTGQQVTLDQFIKLVGGQLPMVVGNVVSIEAVGQNVRAETPSQIPWDVRPRPVTPAAPRAVGLRWDEACGRYRDARGHFVRFADVR
jgi:hypothetical protein